jgi:hypothetical protein
VIVGHNSEARSSCEPPHTSRGWWLDCQTLASSTSPARRPSTGPSSSACACRVNDEARCSGVGVGNGGIFAPSPLWEKAVEERVHQHAIIREDDRDMRQSRREVSQGHPFMGTTSYGIAVSTDAPSRRRVCICYVAALACMEALPADGVGAAGRPAVRSEQQQVARPEPPRAPRPPASVYSAQPLRRCLFGGETLQL